MNILYFNPGSPFGAEREMIADRFPNVVSTNEQADALQLIRKQSFDAVVIQNQNDDGEVLDFTVDVCGLEPTLPVFLTSDWGKDLTLGLKDLANGAFVG